MSENRCSNCSGQRFRVGFPATVYVELNMNEENPYNPVPIETSLTEDSPYIDCWDCGEELHVDEFEDEVETARKFTLFHLSQ